ncbi:MAG: hypothetical protein BIFFINMI_00475 [Phycisphaerae bacterium]|nr:hypothetical protein [Phycisphaerae bacterium]
MSAISGAKGLYKAPEGAVAKGAQTATKKAVEKGVKDAGEKAPAKLEKRVVKAGDEIPVPTPSRATAPKGPINRNSRSFQGDSHVYVIKAPDGSIHKVGKSSAGTRVTDGASIRAESQVRKLNRIDIKNGGYGGYSSEIRKRFGSSGETLDYEARWRDTYRRLYGEDKLPGNREFLRGRR